MFAAFRTFIRVFLCAAVLAAGISLADIQASPTPHPTQFSPRDSVALQDSVEVRVDSIMSVYPDDGPGAVVGVIRDGDVAFSKAYGMADLTHGVPITTETRFNVASASKQFTGFAIAVLAKEGRLSLDDPVVDYLPSLPTFADTVTIGHLVSHTSGYRPAYGTLALAGRADGFSREEAFEVVRNQRELQFPPGTQKLYNSTGYILLAEIVERVSGMSFPDWIQDRVFDPLGMENTAFEREPGDVIPGSAYSYSKGEHGRYRLEAPTDASYGAGDIFTTIGDWAKWMHNYETAALGGESVIRQMMTPYVLANGDTTNYGFGLRIDDHRGLRRVKHAGATEGYWTQFYYYPDIDGGVVVMSNYDEVIPKERASAIAELFFGDQMQAKPAPNRGAAADADARPSIAQLRQYAGSYRMKTGDVVELKLQGDTLVSMRGGGIPLIPRSKTTFQVKGTQQRVRFVIRSDGTVRRAILQAPSRSMTLRPVAPWSPSPATLEKYAGRYYTPELQTAYTFRVEEDQLVATHRWVGDLRFAPTEEDTFRSEQTGMEIRFERNEDGEVTGYYASLWEARNVWFERQAQ
jgi:CubicO group peptidase (beta-lactamase class C family)